MIVELLFSELCSSCVPSALLPLPTKLPPDTVTCAASRTVSRAAVTVPPESVTEAFAARIAWPWVTLIVPPSIETVEMPLPPTAPRPSEPFMAPTQFTVPERSVKAEPVPVLYSSTPDEVTLAPSTVSAIFFVQFGAKPLFSPVPVRISVPPPVSVTSAAAVSENPSTVRLFPPRSSVKVPAQGTVPSVRSLSSSTVPPLEAAAMASARVSYSTPPVRAAAAARSGSPPPGAALSRPSDAFPAEAALRNSFFPPSSSADPAGFSLIPSSAGSVSSSFPPACPFFSSLAGAASPVSSSGPSPSVPAASVAEDSSVFSPVLPPGPVSPGRPDASVSAPSPSPPGMADTSVPTVSSSWAKETEPKIPASRIIQRRKHMICLKTDFFSRLLMTRLLRSAVVTLHKIWYSPILYYTTPCTPPQEDLLKK